MWQHRVKTLIWGKCRTYANVAKEEQNKSAQVSFISPARRSPQICSDPPHRGGFLLLLLLSFFYTLNKAGICIMATVIRQRSATASWGGGWMDGEEKIVGVLRAWADQRRANRVKWGKGVALKKTEAGGKAEMAGERGRSLWSCRASPQPPAEVRLYGCFHHILIKILTKKMRGKEGCVVSAF